MMRQRPYGIISWDKQAVIAEQQNIFSGYSLWFICGVELV